jgi:hypothetical protein
MMLLGGRKLPSCIAYGCLLLAVGLLSVSMELLHSLLFVRLSYKEQSRPYAPKLGAGLG